MKELSIEEKAKAYDEALEKAKNYHSPETACNVKIAMENLFPELKESEDERIRKDIISHFAKGIEGSSFDEVIEKYKIWIAWLEKQGEQKPAELSKEIPTDLKDIVDNEANAIWKEESSDSCHLVIDSFNMFYGICMQIAEAVVDYKKPAWSEDDEAKLKSILFHIEDVENKDVIDWLKSLKERYTWKPSEEQMDALNDVISSRDIKYDVLSELWNDLKKLRKE